MATDDQLKGILAKLELKLSALNQRLVSEGDALTFEDATTQAIVDALANIPGALSVAADMVSGSLFQGLGDTFDANTDEVDSEVGGGGGAGWDYTAVMDASTCDECASHDGEHYDTWDEIAGAGGPLPDGGPNPDCYGTDRCRCRTTIA
jgi:hypothetical protein